MCVCEGEGVGVLTCGLGDAGDEQQKQQPMIHGDTWCQQGAVDRKKQCQYNME